MPACLCAYYTLQSVIAARRAFLIRNRVREIGSSAGVRGVNDRCSAMTSNVERLTAGYPDARGRAAIGAHSGRGWQCEPSWHRPIDRDHGRPSISRKTGWGKAAALL